MLWVALKALEKYIARTSDGSVFLSRLVLAGLIEASTFAMMLIWRMNGGSRWWRDVPWTVEYRLGQLLVLAFPVALAFLVTRVVLPRQLCAQFEARWKARSLSSRRTWSRVLLALWFAWAMGIAATFAIAGKYQVQL
jgi:hypothetical protein